MNLRPEQYDEMFRIYPGLEGYINRCRLKNELEHLERNEYILSDFDKKRLNFLRESQREFKTF